MRFARLPYRNLRAWGRYYRLMALAATIAVGVIVGSLVVGDSVRATLVRRVAERLGDIETVIFSRGSYMDEGLADRVASARGVLLVEGFVSRGGRLIPVTVWGVNDKGLAHGTATVNEALEVELGAVADGDDIVLRLPSGGLVPSGSLFVTRNYTASLRLTHGGVVTVADGGNIGLRNEQTIPLNIFVDRTELAEAIGVPGKINLILAPTAITEREFAAIWSPEASGLTLRRAADGGGWELTSDRIFLQQEVVESVERRTDRLFSYLVNSIAIENGEGTESSGEAIPYSFATAVDSFGGVPLGPDEAIISDYTARRLGARPGDRIRVSWFHSGDFKTLSTDSIVLKVSRIVPLETLKVDAGLSADFPGLSDVERCTDWDSDLPLDMTLILPEDERYWELHRDTPKILVPYSAVAPSWGNRYGTATAVRTAGNDPPDLARLTPAMTGIEVLHPRAQAEAAARGGVDFSSLFLALGCFIVASALVLMTLPLGEMMLRRRGEFAAMSALGFTRRRIGRMVWRESAPVVVAGAVAGVVAGLLYTAVVVRLLGGLWRGATHTGGFAVEAGAGSLAIGFAVGAAGTLLLLRAEIRRAVSSDKRVSGRRRSGNSLRHKKTRAVVAAVAVAASVAANMLYFNSVTFFVITGVLFIAAAAIWGDLLLFGTATTTGRFSHKTLTPIALTADARGALRAFAVLSAGVFVVFSVGLNRCGFGDPAQIKTGTGGYALWGESSVPIYHNLATEETRRAFGLDELPAGTRLMQPLRYGADDAGCLNLNRVSEPTVLGIDMKGPAGLASSDFRIAASLAEVDGFESFGVRRGTAIPALVDATVLEWGLGKRLGDTLWYRSGAGEQVALVLAATLENSVFQGNIVIDRKLFGEIWPEITGSQLLLAALPGAGPNATVDSADLRTVAANIEQARDLLARSLAEYGVRVSTTANRLREFNSVSDTYLSIFFTFGCLGLLLGIAGFVVTVRRNLVSRGDEIRLMRDLGFTHETTARLLTRENVVVPLYAIGTGIAGAVLGVVGNASNATPAVWLGAACAAVLFILCTVLFVSRSTRREVAAAMRKI